MKQLSLTDHSTSNEITSDAPKVALFQAFWKLHSSTLFAASALSRAGYQVDVFLFCVDEVVPNTLLQSIKNVSVYNLEPAPLSRTTGGGWEGNSGYRAVQEIGQRILRESRRSAQRLLTLLRFLTRSDKGLIPAPVIANTFAILRQSRYRALIGIEKGGLAWAGTMAGRVAVPLLYSSLELYTRNHWFYAGCYTQKRLKLAEERYHRRCWATIVQDEARGKVLLTDNSVQNGMKMLYLPISRLGEGDARRSNWLQKRLGLPDDRVVILSHGMIATMRFSLEIAMVAQTFPPDWALVIHGYGESSVIRKIRELDTRSKVHLSLDLVDVADEHLVVSSSHISLVFYTDKYLNDKLTGFSSEKLALSLQCGVPVIAFDYPTYQHIREAGCGVLIKELSEIPDAVSVILAEYPGYRSRALSAFRTYYQFETNFSKVLNALDSLP